MVVLEGPCGLKDLLNQRPVAKRGSSRIPPIKQLFLLLTLFFLFHIARSEIKLSSEDPMVFRLLLYTAYLDSVCSGLTHLEVHQRIVRHPDESCQQARSKLSHVNEPEKRGE